MGFFFAYKMYILDHAVAPWFLEVTVDLKRSFTSSSHSICPGILQRHLQQTPAESQFSLFTREGSHT